MDRVHMLAHKYGTGVYFIFFFTVCFAVYNRSFTFYLSVLTIETVYQCLPVYQNLHNFRL